MTYKVVGYAHGSNVDEHGFGTIEEAQAYGSRFLDGDTEGWIEILTEDSRGVTGSPTVREYSL